ncbi:phage terminase small subunit P27 family [Clostridium sp.]|uniref:phage terminase small subunit P27 family n=1 Tax=Clostridium sp. TaxID=1506 RepID=UPI003996084F
MARPKQPIEVIKAKGKKHLTKAEIEAREAQELKPSSNNIEAPSFLNKKLKDKFNIIAKELQDLGIMSNLDCNYLGYYLINELKYQQICKQILKVDVGTEEYDRLLKQQDKVFKILRASASDMGLNISSRCKLIVPKVVEEQPKNKFSSFLDGDSNA